MSCARQVVGFNSGCYTWLYGWVVGGYRVTLERWRHEFSNNCVLPLMQAQRRTVRVAKELQARRAELIVQAERRCVDLGGALVPSQRVAAAMSPGAQYMEVCLQLEEISGLSKAHKYLATIPAAREVVCKAQDAAYVARLKDQKQKLERSLITDDRSRAMWQPGGDAFEVRVCGVL